MYSVMRTGVDVEGDGISEDGVTREASQRGWANGHNRGRVTENCAAQKEKIVLTHFDMNNTTNPRWI